MPTFIRPPASLPFFQAAGHSFQDDPRFAVLKPTTGHRRRRRLWTTAPRTYDVEWLLNDEQMADFQPWFKDTLRAGERHFIAPVRTEAGLRYWEAVWAEPYFGNPYPVSGGLLWPVTGSIVTFGEPTVEPPASGVLAAEYGLALEIDVAIAGSAALFAEYGLALERALALTAEYGLALEHFVPQFLQREDGSYFEREDDSGGIQREDT